jgi:hypothetical protein
MTIGLVVFQGIEDTKQTIDDFISEDILLYFDVFGLNVQFGYRHGRVYRTLDVFFV